MAARLIVEVDGSQHGHDAGIRKDVQRTQWLDQEGYRVLRFWNNEVTENINGVLEAIYAALYASPDFDVAAYKHEHARGMRHPTPARSARRPSPSRGG